MDVLVGAAAAVCATVAALRCCQSKNSGLRCRCYRFAPGTELKSALVGAVRESGAAAACVVSCVGSLRRVKLRMAGADRHGGCEPVVLDKRLEIVSLVGTFAEGGACHLHASVSDDRGEVTGGHVVGDMIVNTTAEVVIGVCDGYRFSREFDDQTGFNELKVR
eukprot:TRINITY_DN20394_c0_g1_i3.p1 TRINITY_DN20394_c0_g1~~TRINITY_DN20394_c0_g1_i3.p1  ORF type:complete len:189 (+),score=58.49 TRINITY_DN20394_c0_g1_i3:79-567(+)